MRNGSICQPYSGSIGRDIVCVCVCVCVSRPQDDVVDTDPGALDEYARRLATTGGAVPVAGAGGRWRLPRGLVVGLHCGSGLAPPLGVGVGAEVAILSFSASQILARGAADVDPLLQVLCVDLGIPVGPSMRVARPCGWVSSCTIMRTRVCQSRIAGCNVDASMPVVVCDGMGRRRHPPSCKPP